MLHVYARTDAGLIEPAGDPRAALVETGVVWVDLMRPQAGEEAVVEAALGVDAPTSADRAALEESARFYEEGSSLVLVVPVLAESQASAGLARHPVAFVLDRNRLLTVRDCEHPVFSTGRGRASASIAQATGAADVMLSLLEGLIERTADQILTTTETVEALSEVTLGGKRAVRLERTLKQLGQHGVMAARCRDVLAGLARAARFTVPLAGRHGLDRDRLQALVDDATGLQRQAEALMNDLTFLLDAVLGLVGTRQNETLKIMAVVTLLLVPPTLIASIFGMNFEVIPLLKDAHGFWFAVGGMAMSSLLVIAIGRIGRWI